MHGAGNDYIYVDARQTETEWPEVARRMSDRHFGVGGDGLILVLPSSKADVRMRMFNADGSEAEMCGNGVRCFAKYVLERGIVESQSDVLSVETLAGIIQVHPIWRGGSIVAARVNMGPPRLGPAEVPVNVEGDGPVIDHPLAVEGRALVVTCVSMGNPHAVAFVEEPLTGFPLRTVGPQVERHPLFPNRVNFEVANVEGRSQVRARVWERGSGETLACATGACAVTVAARLKRLVNGKVDISMPGGVLEVEWAGEGDVWLEGPAHEVFTGEWRE